MKKIFVIAVLGLAVSEAHSVAQGSLSFNSYTANGSAGILINFAGAMSGPVGAGYTADLLWSLTPITELAGFGPLNLGWNLSGNGSPSVQSVATPFGTTPTTQGYFQSPVNFMLNPYTDGTTVWFDVIVYQTVADSYASSTVRSHSASFSTTLPTGLNFPTDLGVAGLVPFDVVVLPEPTTLTLVGIGSLITLMALCSQQCATKQQT